MAVARASGMHRNLLLLAGVGAALSGCAIDEVDDSGIGGGKADGFGSRSYAMKLDASWTLCEPDREDSDGDRITDECKAGGKVEQAPLGITGFVTLQDGNAGTLHLCDAIIPPISGEKISLLDGALTKIIREFTWHETSADGVSGVATDPIGIGVGARLADPLRDALPTSARDQRVVDIDEDGEPGISLVHDWASVYVAFRFVTELSGTFDAQGVLRGSVGVDADMTVLGDSTFLFDAQAEWDKAKGKTRVMSEDHRLTLTPIDASAAHCANQL